jgi:hypothetical protein
MILIKVNEVGSLRWIGENFNSLPPNQTIIGGNSIEEISRGMKISAYKLGKFNQNNAFLLFTTRLIYIYVNPKYKGYRDFVKEIIKVPSKYDVDHFLSKKIAISNNVKYVMIGVVPEKINRKHGNYEKASFDSAGDTNSEKIFYCNRRIYNKILSRNSKARIDEIDLKKGYDLKSKPEYGLSLKQKGRWNYSLGLNLIDFDNVSKRIKLIV